MSVQWFPGHMHATQKALRERLKTTDVVIELLDARLPGSSANPLLAQLIGGRPTLKVLNKEDLADPVRTAQWLAHYNAQPHTRAIALHAHTPGPARTLVAECRRLAPHRGGMVKPLRVLIAGIPNVGKSTLINTLLGKRAAKAADEPGVTKQEQRVVLADDVYLYDTPGMLWPKIIVPESGDWLAASGAVGRNAFDEEEVALALLRALQADYPERLEARYRLGLTPAAIATCPDHELLATIGRKRGALLPGGRVDPHKAGEVLLADFRAGALGRITLETPASFAAWLHAAQVAEAQRQAQRAARRAAQPPGAQAPAPAADGAPGAGRGARRRGTGAAG
ncbi:Ribosome biogenesis GTPase A [Tepidimonas thermarum]|uniref:Ribosome biogenesis GTPase A n=1 Tax=Tepidimonas thermarum TaxID=335431 RepID=A0A554WWY8_9BURK|nr:ribosome biogenesis GTPase YlqF [Tepidimonas thermarum]TSE28093.1 Ribosome biogenesis GTPase A [Tepidimonas thermarum]